MGLVELVLTYRPHGTGDELPAVPVAVTKDPWLLRAAGERVLEAARAEARFWEAIDPGVAVLKRAEAGRLSRVIAFLLPAEAGGDDAS